MDMTGNVWEWVYDWYDANFYKKPAASRNPFGPLQSFDPISQKPQYRYKVLRGGSYTGSPSPLWTSYRFRLLPNTRSNDIGFRCVLSKVKAPAQPKPPKARLAEDEAAVPGTDSEPSSGSTTENE
jgi:formylglycine-generating enzyme required for sulfatase activity